MKYLYTVLLNLLVCGSYAQTEENRSGSSRTATVKGKIQFENGPAVADVVIRLVDRDAIAVTDSKGFFELRHVPFGKQQLLITSVEIESKTVPLDIQKPFHEIPISVKKIVHNLNEVRVVHKSEKREIETQGFAVNVIDTKQAALRNIQTNELLDRTVGVRVRQSGGVGSEVEYNLNGMSGRSVGVFIDGIEISTYGSSFNLNSIPPAMIDRIEVYKGVLPSHLSGDYMGGAINVVLKKGNSKNSLSAAVSYGSFNTFQSDLSGTFRNAKNGLTFKGSGFYTYTDNSYEIWGKFAKHIEPDGVVRRNIKARRFWDGYRAVGGRFEAGFTDVKWADTFLIGYNVSDSYKENQHGQSMGTPYFGRFTEADARVLSLNYIKKDLFVKGLSLTLNGIYSGRNTYLQDTVGYVYNWDGNIRTNRRGQLIYRTGQGQQGNATITEVERHITTSRANLSYDVVSGHRLSVNHYFYTVDRTDTDILKPVANTTYRGVSDIVKHVTSFNYEAQTFHDKLKTNVFVKFYQQNTSRVTPAVEYVDTKPVLTHEVLKDVRTTTGYGLAASYSLLPNIVLIASAEKAVRMPAEGEVFGTPDENTLPNPGLKPELSNNFNMGFRLGHFNIKDHRLTISGNYFFRNVKDRIMRQTNTNLSDQEVELSPFVNLGLAQSLGFEGELGYFYKNKLNASFTLSKFNSLYKQEFDLQTGQRLAAFYNKQLPNEPFFTMNGNAQYRQQNFIQKSAMTTFFYNVGYVAPFRTIWPKSEWFTTPTQISHDLGVSYQFPKRRVIVSVDAKNVLNAEIYDNFGAQKPGRAFYLKLNYTINNF